MDNDGLTSTAIMYRYIESISESSWFDDNVYIIYNERDKGHGIGNQVDMIQDDTDLVLILDSSSNDVEDCKVIEKKGMDIIVIDHHPVTEENPHVLLVNPQNDNYPNKDLSGAGVCYKVINAIDDQIGFSEAEKYKDLVAVGMIGDIMMLDGEENRKIISDGLDNIVNEGLGAIMGVKKKDINNLSVADIAYGVVPLLNGSARLNNIKKSIDLLTTNDVHEAGKLATELNEMNEKRKKKEIEIFERVKKKANKNDNIIIVIDDDIEKGFNGLIASKLADEFQRPALVLQNKEQNIGGSARSYADLDLKKMLEDSGLVFFTAGHPQALGVAMSAKNKNHLIRYMNKNIDSNDIQPIYEYDLTITEEELDIRDIQEIEKFSRITGMGVPTPRFVIKNLFVNDRRVLGKNNDTIKIESDNLDLMKFKVNDEYADEVGSFDEIDAIGTLNMNVWVNPRTGVKKETMQMFLDDWRFSV